LANVVSCSWPSSTGAGSPGTVAVTLPSPAIVTDCASGGIVISPPTG
jgi:hypothetical protein